MKSKIQIAILIFAMLFFGSCNITKLVPKSDALYTGASIKMEDAALSKKEKNKVISQAKKLPRPLPNKKFLGIHFKLMFYNMSGNPEKGGFIRKFFRKIGQPPVLLSSVNLNFNAKVLQNYLENIGYFQAQAAGDTVVKKRKGRAFYTLTPGAIYTIKDINFEMDSSALGRAIKDTKSKTILHPGDPFNLEVIKGERSRIDAVLKEDGYYYFSPDLLILDADSTIGNNKVNMYLKVKKETAPEAKKPYIIDDVFIYPNYRLNANRADTTSGEKYLYDGYYICLLYTSPSPRDGLLSRMPSSA